MQKIQRNPAYSQVFSWVLVVCSLEDYVGKKLFSKPKQDVLSALPGEKVPKMAHYQVPLSTLILSQTNSKSFHHNTPRQFDAKNSKKPCLQSSLLFAPSCANKIVQDNLRQAVLVGLVHLLCSISVKDVINQKTYY